MTFKLDGTDVLMKLVAFACTFMTAVLYGTPVVGDEVWNEESMRVAPMPWHEALTGPV